VSVQDVLRNVRAALEDANISYMVTGSFASSVHGVPRATNDIDIVIEPTREQLRDTDEQVRRARLRRTSRRSSRCPKEGNNILD